MKMHKASTDATRSLQLDTLREHYRNLYHKHGDSAGAVQYSDDASHKARFAVLRAVDPNAQSILDVGCGLGHLYRYLKEQGFSGRYTGVDIVPEFIATANEHMITDPQANALLVAGDEALPQGHEYVVLSGVFNNLMDDNAGFISDTLKRMFAVAEKGIAFNAMSTYVDYEDDKLYYTNPLELLHFCKQELGGHPLLRHDYSLSAGGYPFEYAVYVYKQPRIPL